MKKLISLIVALCICVCAFSCGKRKCLYDLIVSVTVDDDTLSKGHVICYGRMHENSIGSDTLCEYLGLFGYPEFEDKIEELAVYSSVGGSFYELAAMRVYSACDIADGVLFFERRIHSAKRARMFDVDTSAADNAIISVYGNTIVLFMMNDNKAFQKKLEKLM